MSEQQMRFLIGDTETTGLPPCKACEIGLIEFDPSTFQVLQQWESLVDPEMEISAGAIAVHGITNEMVKDSPTSDEFIEHVLKGKLEGDICLIAHNRKFDIPMLKHIGNVTHGICTLELARSLVKDSANHKLQTLREYFGIAETTAHRALGDCQVTLAVLQKLVEISGRSVHEHAATTVKVIHSMPFGKHKGVALMQLSVSYIDYMFTLDLDDNLRNSLRNVRNLK